MEGVVKGQAVDAPRQERRRGAGVPIGVTTTNG